LQTNPQDADALVAAAPFTKVVLNFAILRMTLHPGVVILLIPGLRRVALGKALTWREDTRREGIALLEPMASGNKEADSGTYCRSSLMACG
jgi:hypothetical protein